MKAFILISVRTGGIKEVVRNLNKITQVNKAYMTFGPYDAVVVVEAESVKDIGRIIASEIQPIPGIVGTLTCLAVDE